jgi:hypothetical protein
MKRSPTMGATSRDASNPWPTRSGWPGRAQHRLQTFIQRCAVKLDDLTIAALLQRRAGPADNNATQQDAGSPLAWRREMERAQADAWFHEALQTPQDRREQAGPRDQRASQRRSAPVDPHPMVEHHPATDDRRQGAPLLPAQRERFAAVVKTLAAQPGVSPVPGVAAPPIAVISSAAPRLGMQAEATAPRPAVDLPVPPNTDRPSIALAALLEPAGPEALEANLTELHTARARPPAGEPHTERLPVRVHIEGDAQRATVWLGVDAQAHAELPAVAEAIGRWLAQAGYGVPTFVCNGRVIDKTGHEFAMAEDRVSDRTPATPAFEIEPPTGESA